MTGVYWTFGHGWGIGGGNGGVAITEELAAAEERLGKLPGLNTETTWILPMQARYVIGRDGVIAYADINADYSQHPDPHEILPLLRNMSGDA